VIDASPAALIRKPVDETNRSPLPVSFRSTDCPHEVEKYHQSALLQRPQGAPHDQRTKCPATPPK
jgi:hypothetical protein